MVSHMYHSFSALYIAIYTETSDRTTVSFQVHPTIISNAKASVSKGQVFF